MYLRRSAFALCCIVMGMVVLAACGSGGAPAASITPTNQSDVLPNTSPTPVWAVFPHMPTTPYTVDALYQPFEQGIMVWRSDENCVYAFKTVDRDLRRTDGNVIIPVAIPGDATFHEFALCLTVAPLTGEGEMAAPPAGHLLPTGALGKVWGTYTEIRTELGYALQPEIAYVATIPVVLNIPEGDGMPFYMPQMTLPNGRILACGARDATSGSCLFDFDGGITATPEPTIK